MVRGLKLWLMGCAMLELPIWGVCHCTYILLDAADELHNRLKIVVAAGDWEGFNGGIS